MFSSHSKESLVLKKCLNFAISSTVTYSICYIIDVIFQKQVMIYYYPRVSEVFVVCQSNCKEHEYLVDRYVFNRDKVLHC